MSVIRLPQILRFIDMTDKPELPAHLVPGEDYDKDFYTRKLVENEARLVELKLATGRSVVCPDCAMSNFPWSKFCGSCGAAQKDPVAIPADPDCPGDPVLAKVYNSRLSYAACDFNQVTFTQDISRDIMRGRAGGDVIWDDDDHRL